MGAWKTRTLLVCAVLAVLAVAPYVQTTGFGFIDFDDDQFVTKNPPVLAGLTWRSVQWASRAIVVANWHPLTMLSHMLDCDLYRQSDGTQWAGGHHLTNVVLHAANTIVLFGAIILLTGAFWRSAMVATLFAVHPLHVESVAWISERKDVLCTLFGLLAIVAYARYVQRPSIWRYSAVVLGMVLSLMSKPMWVTLPCVLLLLDIWPLRRIRVWGIGQDDLADRLGSVPARSINAAVFEKVPLLALSAASGVITMIFQQGAGAMEPATALLLHDRFFNAIVAYAMYLYMLAIPMNLTVYYPHPTIWPLVMVGGCSAVLVTISSLSIMLRRSRPWLLIGWLLYLGMLVPVIGIVQVGGQFMADRYMYVPAIWVFFMVIWSIPIGRVTRSAVPVISVVVLATLAVASYAQVGYWRDTEVLFTRALALTRNNAIAHLVLADVYAVKGENVKAEEHFRNTLTIRPYFVFAHARYALFLINRERYAEALEHLSTQMSLEPSAFAAHYAGVAHMKLQEWIDAERAFRRSLELDVTNGLHTRENLANVMIQQGRLDDARLQLAQALESDAKSFEANNSLGLINLMQGRLTEAEQSLLQALEINPDNWETRANYGRVLLDLKRYDEAIDHLAAAQIGHPERVFIRTNLARSLASAGRREDAISELQSILAISPQFEPALTLLRELTPSSTP